MAALDLFMAESLRPSRQLMDSTTILIPRAATMDGFTSASSAADGVSLLDLEPLTTLLVHTCNSQYRIVISEQTAIFVQGGQFFPQMTDARLDGASFGGSFLKVGWIGIGLCMEIWARGERIITSPVRAIAREAPGRTH